MYGNPQKRSSAEVQELRRAGGRWLKALREAAGMSQSQLAVKLDAKYYTFISQLEIGRGRIPIDRYRDWAAALGVNPREFVKTLLQYYDPVTYEILFDD
jgi:transcriptional regulator with XRE-family HTH domain